MDRVHSLPPIRKKGLKASYIISVPAILVILASGCGNKGSGPTNNVPVIQSVSADPDTVRASGSARVSCSATDQDNDILVYSWISDYGSFPISSSGSVALWRAPADTGVYPVTAIVSDGELADSESVEIVVIEQTNRAPVIQEVAADPQSVGPDGVTELTCTATDPDGDSLVYDWSAEAGSFPMGESGPVVQWQAPGNFGDYYIHITVNDGEYSALDSVSVSVIEPSGFH